MQLTVLPEHPCVYLPDRMARMEAVLARRILPEQYHTLMDMGFRRSGQMIYRPTCVNCSECRSLRVDVNQFVMSKSDRRVWRKNSDLLIEITNPRPDEEKFALYQRYMQLRHHSTQEENIEDFSRFLYDSPTETAEIAYRDSNGKLIGVGICDVSPQSLSTVYFYFEPDQHRRSLGNFSALYEIELARKLKIPWYYMGYWIAQSKTMSYKSKFKPHEVLENRSCWVRR